MLPEFTISLPNHKVTLRNVAINRESGFALERQTSDGSIGVDFLRSSGAVTIDLQRMFVRVE